ncbi:MAG: hypothetical protein VKP72_02440 [bacterium]|nr:hypothetical protein [bacterium]
MTATDRVTALVRLGTACCLLLSLGACAGDLYPEAPTPTRSAAPGSPGGATWQTDASQIQTLPTVLGNLTFTPLLRSDDPERVQFVITLQPDEGAGTAAPGVGTGTLDLLPRSGPSTRLTLATTTSTGITGLGVETRVEAGQTLSLTARLNVRGVSISGNFTFTAP